MMRHTVCHTVETAYEQYADLLYRLALSHLQHHEDALDAVQDVFLKFAASPKTFSDDEHERAWFIRVTINRCHDLQRRRTVRKHASLDEVAELSDESNVRPAVLEAVDTLADNLKSAVVLHYLEGFSVEETAKVLRISVSAIKMRLSRARDLLKTALS